MKRILLQLLAAFALPTAVNAEIINLECTAQYAEWQNKEVFEESEQYKIYIDIDTVGQFATVDDDDGYIKKFNTFITRDAYLLTFLNNRKKTKDTFDISRTNGSYIYSEKILKYDSESAYFDESSYQLLLSNLEKYGDLLDPYMEGGICKKAEKTKTLF